MGQNMMNRQLVLWLSQILFSANDKRIERQYFETIQMALRFIPISYKKEFFICIDSKSVSKAFQNMKLNNASMYDLVMLHHEVAKNITISCWIPIHIGIAKNEKTDNAIHLRKHAV